MKGTTWLAVWLPLLCEVTRGLIVIPPRQDLVDFGAPGGSLDNNASSAESKVLVFESVPATFGLPMMAEHWYDVNLVLPPPEDPFLCNWNYTVVEKAWFASHDEGFGKNRQRRRTTSEEEEEDAKVEQVRMRRTVHGEVQVERAPTSLRGGQPQQQPQDQRDLSFRKLNRTIAVAILARRGGCFFFEKGMAAMNLRRQLPLRGGLELDVQFVVVYNQIDADGYDRLFEMGPPKQEQVDFDLSTPIDLHLVSIKNEAGLGLLSAMTKVANATYQHGENVVADEVGTPPLPHITDFATPSARNQEWSFVVHIESSVPEPKEAESANPSNDNNSDNTVDGDIRGEGKTFGRINRKDQDGQHDEQRFNVLGILTRVCFALLIAVPILRNSVSWYRAGGRIRVRRRAPGDFGYHNRLVSWIPRVYAVQPMVLDDNGNPILPGGGGGGGGTSGQRRRGLLTEEQVLALPESVYDPNGVGLDKLGDRKKPSLSASLAKLKRKASGRKLKKDGDSSDDSSKDLTDKDDASVSSSSASMSKAPDVVHVEQTLPLESVDGVTVEQESDHSNMESAFEQSTCCSICLEDYEEGEKVRQLPKCKHTFHTSCILPWLTQRQGCCPLCKVPVLGQAVDFDEDEEDDDMDQDLSRGDPLGGSRAPRRVMVLDSNNRTYDLDNEDDDGLIITLDSLENGRAGVASRGRGPSPNRRHRHYRNTRMRARTHRPALPTVLDNEQDDDDDVDDDATPVARGSYTPSYPHNDDDDDATDVTPVARGGARRSARRVLDPATEEDEDDDDEDDDDSSSHSNHQSRRRSPPRGEYTPPVLLVTTDKKQSSKAESNSPSRHRQAIATIPEEETKQAAVEDDDEDVYVPPRGTNSRKEENDEDDDKKMGNDSKTPETRPSSEESSDKEEVAASASVPDDLDAVAKDVSNVEPAKEPEEEEEKEDAAAAAPVTVPDSEGNAPNVPSAELADLKKQQQEEEEEEEAKTNVPLSLEKEENVNVTTTEEEEEEEEENTVTVERGVKPSSLDE